MTGGTVAKVTMGNPDTGRAAGAGYAAFMSQNMSAMVAREFGGPEVFERREIPRPQAGPGQVLVRVKASSVNPVDTKIRSGMLAAMAPEPPMVLGCDVAGVVEECGEGVTAFRSGDEIYGCAGGVRGFPGALAEYMAADAQLLAPKPAGLTFEQAAALPLVSITAWDGLLDRARVHSGQRVLVHGGAGGVGHIALQLCAAQGAEVWATVSSEEKAAIARSLGAAGTILYREELVDDYVQRATGGAGFDVVFDSVGGDNVARCFQAAAVSGTVVSISTRTTADLSPLHAKGLTLHVVFMIIPLLYNRGRAHHGEILRELSELVAAGKVRPLVDARQFRFDEVAQAHAYLQSGKATGKIVLTGF
jgi:NADPH2:quinone reductase